MPQIRGGAGHGGGGAMLPYLLWPELIFFVITFHSVFKKRLNSSHLIPIALIVSFVSFIPDECVGLGASLLVVAWINSSVDLSHLVTLAPRTRESRFFISFLLHHWQQVAATRFLIWSWITSLWSTITSAKDPTGRRCSKLQQIFLSSPLSSSSSHHYFIAPIHY